MWPLKSDFGKTTKDHTTIVSRKIVQEFQKDMKKPKDPRKLIFGK
jgi:hypothetical protein